MQNNCGKRASEKMPVFYACVYFTELEAVGKIKVSCGDGMDDDFPGLAGGRKLEIADNCTRLLCFP